AHSSSHALSRLRRARPRPRGARRLRGRALAAAPRAARRRRGGVDATTVTQGDAMTKREAAAAKLTAAYEKILEAFDDLGYPVKTDANSTETAARAARAMVELVKPTDEIKSQIDEMLSRTFPAQYDEMVISKHNISFGMCPHHLLPVIYRISVAYLPGDRVLGISKLSRMVHLLAHRPLLQEDLTQELAALLHERMETRGS